jgi:hypothetical protein
VILGVKKDLKATNTSNYAKLMTNVTNVYPMMLASLATAAPSVC